MAAAQRGAALAPPQVSMNNVPIFRLSVKQYQRMEQAGILLPEHRVELIEGILVSKGIMNPPHAVSLERVGDELRPRIPQGWCLRTEKDITLPDSQPRPDAVIAVGARDDYANHHPGPSNISLLVEVADATLAYDQNAKLQMYARARIRVYWIVNIPDRQVEIYTQPRSGQNPTYRHTQILTEADNVTVTLGPHTLGPIAVADLVPPA